MIAKAVSSDVDKFLLLLDALTGRMFRSLLDAATKMTLSIGKDSIPSTFKEFAVIKVRLFVDFDSTLSRTSLPKKPILIGWG